MHGDARLVVVERQHVAHVVRLEQQARMEFQLARMARAAVLFQVGGGGARDYIEPGQHALDSIRAADSLREHQSDVEAFRDQIYMPVDDGDFRDHLGMQVLERNRSPARADACRT